MRTLRPSRLPARTCGAGSSDCGGVRDPECCTPRGIVEDIGKASKSDKSYAAEQLLCVPVSQCGTSCIALGRFKATAERPRVIHARLAHISGVCLHAWVTSAVARYLCLVERLMQTSNAIAHPTAGDILRLLRRSRLGLSRHLNSHVRVIDMVDHWVFVCWCYLPGPAPDSHKT